MKYLRRYLSLLFALVMSLGAFSITAHAAETPNYQLKVETYDVIRNQTVYSNDNIYNSGWSVNQSFGSSTSSYSISANAIYPTFFQLHNADNSLLVHKNEKAHISLSGLNFDLRAISKSGSVYHFSPINVAAYVVDSSGQSSYLNADDISVSVSDYTYTVDIDFTASSDISKVVYYFEMQQSFSGDGYLKLVADANSLGIDISIQDVTSEKLDGILGWIKNIWTGITELPSKIWGFIEDGLKKLFVPTDSDITAYKEKWDTLLSTRLGAVYEVVNVLTDSWDGVMAADQTNTIHFPSVSIPLPGGSSFTFGGYDVQIVPDGFTILAAAVKTAVGIVCTIAFVNGLRKRYDEIMGVEK